MSDGSYQSNPQRVDIGHELQRACRQAQLTTPGKFHIEVDTILLRHMFQNAQVDQPIVAYEQLLANRSLGDGHRSPLAVSHVPRSPLSKTQLIYTYALDRKCAVLQTLN